MASLEVNANSFVCSVCGRAYGRRKGYFPVCYGYLYRGTGHLPYCKECVDGIYNNFIKEYSDPKMAVRQTCRKLDLYWNSAIYDRVAPQNTQRNLFSAYLSKANQYRSAGKCYDDTIKEESGMQGLSLDEYTRREIATAQTAASSVEQLAAQIELPADDAAEEPVPDEVRDFWGPGYTPEMYRELEQRRAYYMAKFPDGYEPDIGTEVIIRQICNLEIEINKGRTTGGNIAQSVKVLNELLGSANMKPIQKKAGELDAELERTPMGVWIQRWEEKRPLPDPDPEMQDRDGIVKYISVWFLGHLSKMLNIKNGYSALYEKELSKLRVDRPEYVDEDDEEFFNDVFSGGDDP